MLMQIFSQIVGNLVLISLAATLFLYVGFKRHQKNYKGYLSYITGYGSILISMIVLFTTYFRSVELRFTVDMSSQSTQDNSNTEASTIDFDVMGTRPYQACNTTPILQWRPDCLLRSLETRTGLNYSFKTLVSHSNQESEDL
jgi:hypothetical protein